ncbi:MAG TPA: hypothetical protein VGM05_18365 [Planctomycetaceae bacterium]
MTARRDWGRKTVDLRIPVTAGQKELIYAALAGDEFARWPREVLMRAAAERQRDSPAANREWRGESGEEKGGRRAGRRQPPDRG